MKSTFLLPTLFSLLAHPAFTCAENSTTTNILLPLYVYPGPGAWDPVYNAIASNPSLQFQIVINPSSGPGIPSSSNGSSNGTNLVGYDANWINATATINSFDNARTFGYVHLMNGESAIKDVEQNITTWKAWGNASHPDLDGRNASIHGIFFDESPDNMTEYMANLTTFAHTMLDGSSTDDAEGEEDGPINIIFNPGKVVLDNAYFTLADHVIVCEIAAENYSTKVPTENVPKEYASHASILIYDFEDYEDSSEEKLRSWLRGMVHAGIGSVNVVSKGWDQSALDSTDSAPADIGTVATLLMEGKAGRVSGGGLGVLVMVVSGVVGLLMLL